jgi:hypothetical protein
VELFVYFDLELPSPKILSVILYRHEIYIGVGQYGDEKNIWMIKSAYRKKKVLD